jgi:hypothetical protein
LASIEKLVSLNPAFLYYSHFGKGFNAVQRLKDYAEQIRFWANVAEEGVRNGLTVEDIRKRYLQKTKLCVKSVPS